MASRMWTTLAMIMTYLKIINLTSVFLIFTLTFIAGPVCLEKRSKNKTDFYCWVRFIMLMDKPGYTEMSLITAVDLTEKLGHIYTDIFKLESWFEFFFLFLSAGKFIEFFKRQDLV